MSFGFESNCERCGKKLEDRMVMSMFNMEIICMECKKEEKFFEMLAGEQEKEGLLLSLYVRFATDLYKYNRHTRSKKYLLMGEQSKIELYS